MLGPQGIATARAIAGAATGPVFAGVVADLLVPLLRPGQTVVLDNLAVHTRAAAREAVEAAGCRLLVLPPSSPDFDPIAPVFAEVKTARRASAARTPDDLLAATKTALDAVTAADAAGGDADRGFPSRRNFNVRRSNERNRSVRAGEGMRGGPGGNAPGPHRGTTRGGCVRPGYAACRRSA